MLWRGGIYLLLLSTVLVLAAACGSGKHKSPASTPTAAPPLGTPAAAPNATLAVFLRGGDLWIASLDGTTVPPRAITAGAVHAGFSGLAKGPGGGMDLYYVVQLSDQRLAGGRYEADFALYRVAIEGGEREELLRYTSRPLEPFITPNAAVSPDGHSILFADNDGIAMLDLASGDNKRLLTNSPACGGQAGCFGYVNPRWSPRGDRALITKTLWEGAQDVIIDPFASPVNEVVTGGGGSFTARWSPGGDKICMSQSTYSSAGAVMVYDVASGQASDSTSQLSLPASASPGVGGIRIDARGCAWSADGRLAFGYIVPPNYTDVRIAAVDASYAVLAQSPPIPNLIEVVAWLPDGSGVLFNRRSSTRQPPPGIYRPGSGVSDLPFSADTILAVVP